MDELHRFNELFNVLRIDNTLIHVYQILERAATLWPKKTMLLCQDDTMTYQEVYNRSMLFAHE
ncbi:hypothetical protein H0W26_06000, partial [Candidatus Dependentiae bacterium]|nr:hypothetical protein [Candidatus Dependentiae bacterium]